MKQITTIIILLSVLFAFNTLTACKKHHDNYNIGIDIQSEFKNDKVQVYIDGDEILNEQLTTIDVLGVCLPDGIIHKSFKEGKHTLKVVLNDGLTKSKKFDLSADAYIGVMYDRDKNELSFNFSDEKFVYD